MLSRFLDGPLRHLVTAIIVVLGVLVLLAPPISLLTRLDITPLGVVSSIQIEPDAGGMVQDESGAAVIFLPENLGSNLSFQFRSIPPTSFGNLRGNDSIYQEGLDSLGASGLAPLGSFFVLDSNDFSANQKVTVRAPLPPDISEMARMKIVTWQDGQWTTLPSAPNMADVVMEADLPSVPTNFLLVRDTAPGFAEVTMLLEGDQAFLPSEAPGAADNVSISFSRLRGDGALEGEITPVDPSGLKLLLGVSNRDLDGTSRGDLLVNMLSSAGQRENQLATITEAVNANDFAGVYLQYYGLNIHPQAGQLFTEFAQSLGDTLRSQGKRLVIGLETPQQISEFKWDTLGYEWAGLSKAADMLVVPAPIDPFAYRPGYFPFESLLQFATNRIPRQKLAIQLPVHPLAVGNNEYRALAYADAATLMLGQVEVQSSGGSLLMRMNRDHLDPIPTYDQDLFQYRFGYEDKVLGSQLVHVLDATSLRNQLNTLQKYNIRQVVVDLTSTTNVDPQIWAALEEFHDSGGGLPPAASDYKVEYDIFRGSEIRGDLQSGFIETDKRFQLIETGLFKVSAKLSVNGILPGIRSERSVTVSSLTVDIPAELVAAPNPTPVPASDTQPSPGTPQVFTPTGPHLIPTGALVAKSQPSNSAGTSQSLVIGETYLVVGRDRTTTWLQLENSDQIVGWVSTIDANPHLRIAAQITGLPITVQPSSPGISRPSSPGSLWGYGVQAHLLGTNISRAMLSTQTMNFDWMKQQVRWQIFQSDPNLASINWSSLDQIVDTAENFNIKMLFSVLAAPDWAREAGFDPSVDVGPPVNNSYYANFVGAVAGRYCNRSLRAIEVWNEQNLHYEWGNLPLDATAYVSMLREASAAIKRECPSMLVVSGALTPTGTNQTPQSRGGTTALDDLEYLRRMLNAGMLSYVDAVGAHPSGYNVPPRQTKENYCGAIAVTGNSFKAGCPNRPHRSFSFRSTMEEYRAEIVKFDASKPIWPTEFGWAVNSSGREYPGGYDYARDNDYSEQAEWTKDAYVMMKEWGWVAAPILWNLNFRVIAPGTEREQWGIVDQNWNPLPAYVALKELAASEGR